MFRKCYNRMDNMTSDKLDVNALVAYLGNSVLGRRVVYYETIGSTNDIAKELAEAGEPEGTVIITDEQSAGRGRLRRTWIAPPRSSILMSMILRPKLAANQIGRITMAVSLGACDAIQRRTGLTPQIKWPNDVLLNGKKCAGILSEAGLVDDRVEYVVAGLGINVNFTAASVAGMPVNATTIADELGTSVSREDLASSVMQAIDRYYLRMNEAENLRSEWKAQMITLGKSIRADSGERVEQGVAEDVDDDGALLLRRADGSLARLIAGDVTLSTDIS